jgi:hypothetical protein
MSIQDVDEGKNFILGIFYGFRTKIEAIEQRIDNTIKDLQELEKKMYMELTEINDLIAKIEECGGSQDEL